MSEFGGISSENNQIAMKLCDRISIGICAELNGRFQHHAMGFLLVVADAHFLVTCRHSVTAVLHTEVAIRIGPDRNGKANLFTGTFHYPENEENDVAIARLPKYVVDAFGTDRFASFSDIHSSRLPVSTPCVMSGSLRDLSEKWDADVSQTDPKLKVLTYFGVTSEIPTPVPQFNNDLQFVIGADNAVVNSGTVSSWKVVDKLDASYLGISGTPVFAVDGNPFKDGWSPYDVKVIGVQSAFMELETGPAVQKFMRVSRIESVCTVINEVFPEVWQNRKG